MKKIYYLIYEITNLINGKNYIGQHITTNSNDNYMGGGVRIRAAIKKYGRENFKKEILLYAKNEAALNFFEKCLVTPEFISSSDNYNLKEGGGSKGIPSEESKKKMSEAQKGKKRNPENYIKAWETKLKNGTTGRGRKGSPRNSETYRKAQETKIRNSTTGRGRKLSPESIRKRQETRIRNGTTGKGRKLPPLSIETKLKILETKRKNGTLKNKPEAYKKAWETKLKNGTTGRGVKRDPEIYKKVWETRKKIKL